MSTGPDYLHILRNPHGWSEEMQREARLWAADRVEHLLQHATRQQANIDQLRDELREVHGELAKATITKMVVKIEPGSLDGLIAAMKAAGPTELVLQTGTRIDA